MVQIDIIHLNGEPTPVETTFKVSAESTLIDGGPDYITSFKFTKGTAVLEFDRSPAEPIYSIDQQGGGFSFRLHLLDGYKFVLTMRAEEIRNVASESLGIIVDAWTDDAVPGDGVAELSVNVQNYGDLRTDYITTVKGNGCDLGSQIWPQAVILEPAEQHVYLFEVPETRACSMLVQFKSPTGRLYDEVTVP